MFTIASALPSTNEGSLSGSLFCITEGQLLVCTLNRTAKTVPRRIDLPGNASKLAYSKHLKCLIVSYSVSELDTSTDPVRRYTRSFIEFVDPDYQLPSIEAMHSEGGTGPWRPRTAAGEKISCILEWMPEIGRDKYHCIVIGTARKHQSGRGRVIFLRVARSLSDPTVIECSTKHVHQFDGPVYAIAPYGEFTLMVASGHDVVPLAHKLSDSRWDPRARYALLSPAVSLTVHEPYVYISTARESLVILDASDRKLTLYAHDRAKREGLSHCRVQDNPSLTIASSASGTVSVLTEIGVTGNDRLMPQALADAHLPVSVRNLLSSASSSTSTTTTIIYGTALNGSIYRFQLIHEKEWRLLRFLYLICLRDPTICPFTPGRKRRLNPAVDTALLESSGEKPSRMHIDGDVLRRLMECGVPHLREMLAVDEAMVKRLDELSVDLFGQGRSSDPVGDVVLLLMGLLELGRAF